MQKVSCWQEQCLPCFGLRIGKGSPSFQKKYMNVNQTTHEKSNLCLCTVREKKANVQCISKLWANLTNRKVKEYKKRTEFTYINVYYWPQSSQCRKAPQILELVILHTNSASNGNIWTCLETNNMWPIWSTVLNSRQVNHKYLRAA